MISKISGGSSIIESFLFLKIAHLMILGPMTMSSLFVESLELRVPESGSVTGSIFEKAKSVGATCVNKY